MWFDIEVGKTIRIKNQYGQELDRTIISIENNIVTYRREGHEKLSTIGLKRFTEIHNSMGIPYVEGRGGDTVAAFLEQDFDWEEDGQLKIDLRPIDQKYDV
jgi:hypothetical protein